MDRVEGRRYNQASTSDGHFWHRNLRRRPRVVNVHGCHRRANACRTSTEPSASTQSGGNTAAWAALPSPAPAPPAPVNADALPPSCVPASPAMASQEVPMNTACEDRLARTSSTTDTGGNARVYSVSASRPSHVCELSRHAGATDNPASRSTSPSSNGNFTACAYAHNTALGPQPRQAGTQKAHRR